MQVAEGANARKTVDKLAGPGGPLVLRLIDIPWCGREPASAGAALMSVTWTTRNSARARSASSAAGCSAVLVEGVPLCGTKT